MLLRSVVVGERTVIRNPQIMEKGIMCKGYKQWNKGDMSRNRYGVVLGLHNVSGVVLDTVVRCGAQHLWLISAKLVPALD